MSITPLLTTLDSVQGATRIREDDSRKRTDAEIAVDVTPVNYAYLPGDVRRYGADPTGVIPSHEAWQAAIDSNTVVFDGHPEGGIYSFGAAVVPTRYPLKIIGTALNYGSTSGTRIRLLASATTAEAAFHWTAEAYGIRVKYLTIELMDATLEQACMKFDSELRASVIAENYFVTSDQTSNNNSLGIYLVGGGTFSGSSSIERNNFANLKYPVFLAGSITSLKVHTNEIIGSTAATSSIGITIGSACTGIAIYGNGIEGFNTTGARGILSNGTNIRQGFNRFEQCTVSYEWVRGSGNPYIKNRSFANTFTTCGNPIYPLNGTDLCVVDDEGFIDIDGPAVNSVAGFNEHGRAVGLGEFIDMTGANFSAANYTANGSMTWTVASGNVHAHSSSLNGHTMTMEWAIDVTTTGGIANSALRIQIPGGYTANVRGSTGVKRLPCIVQNNNIFSAGMAYVQDGVTYIEIYIDPTGGNNWTLSANTGTHGTIQFEVN